MIITSIFLFQQEGVEVYTPLFIHVMKANCYAPKWSENLSVKGITVFPYFKIISIVIWKDKNVDDSDRDRESGR